MYLIFSRSIKEGLISHSSEWKINILFIPYSGKKKTKGKWVSFETHKAVTDYIVLVPRGNLDLFTAYSSQVMSTYFS